MPPTPSSPLRSEYAERAYQAAYENAVREGIWEPKYELSLEMFARGVGQYIAMAIKSGHGDDPEMHAYRKLTREMALDWRLVNTASMPPLRPDGIDPDLARIAGLAATVQ